MSSIIKMKKGYIFVTIVAVIFIYCSISFFHRASFGKDKASLTGLLGNAFIRPRQHTKTSTVRNYNITWYSLPFYMGLYDPEHTRFDSCQYKNCHILVGPGNVNYSDVVIFDGRLIKPQYVITRRPGQIWIFSAHEAPISFNDSGGHWTRGGWLSAFNWTMTYDKWNTDIHLPYGVIQRKTNQTVPKDYAEIFRRKNVTALIVHSHCPTRSKRETFVNELQKLIDVDSFGACGKPFRCGRHFDHDNGNCFNIINRYKFYLAFENAFCINYFTEKLFSNFNYDSILVIRGGRSNEVNRLLPAGTYISTADFKSIKELAEHMIKLGSSEKLYTEMLKRKDEFYSVPKINVYQRAMCEICKRINNKDKYKKQINSTIQWAFGREQCYKPTDLSQL